MRAPSVLVTAHLAVVLSFFSSDPLISIAAASDGIQIHGTSAAKEDYERNVDSVATATQEHAINQLSALLKKYAKSSQEPVLLLKLAELEQQDATILFRVVHAKAQRTNQAIDLTRYKKMTNQAIQTLNTLIANYPSYNEIAHAYFVRAKSYEEIENKKAAAKDYSYMVTHFPPGDETIAAYMSLADFAIEANDHPKAISYLKEVEMQPEDPHYPFALYKLAWSYYNLKDIPTALHYAETQIHFYDQQKENDGAKGDSPDLVTSDGALRENMLLDATAFYFEGYEEDPSKYSTSNAFSYFHKLEQGPLIARMLLRYTKLLRSHAHDAELIQWKNLVVKEELSEKSARTEALDVILTTYEHLQDRRNYPELTKAALDIVSIYERARDGKTGQYESMPKAQKALLDTAQAMQNLIVKNKDTDEARALSPTLAAFYFAFVKVVSETDPRIPGIHYNLAETLFAIKDYDGATSHYRWVVEHGNWKKKDKQTITVADASLKAIAARYEVLHKLELIPHDITAVSLSKDSPAPLQVALKEWVDWIDEHVKHQPGTADSFLFESNRALYHQGRIVQAMQRLFSFAKSQPKSAYAVPSAALVIDTYIATGDWKLLLQKSEDLREVTEWKNTPFNNRLLAVSADASFKLIEVKAKEKNYPETIAGVERFLKTYSKSERLGDALVLAGTAATESHQDQLAMSYFSRLIQEVPNSKSVKDALNARAQLEEANYLLGASAQDYLSYLKAAGKPDSGLQKKILALLWVDGDWSAVKTALASKDLCTEDTKTECQRYLALGSLMKPELFRVELDEAFDKSRKESGELAAIWAITCLQQAKALGFHDRLLAIRHISKNWDDLDPLVKLAVLPYLNESIPNALAMDRKMMSEVAPLRANAKYITHRVDVMREIENAVTSTMKLPWARIKAGALNELASTYLDFSSALSAIQPKGLQGDELEAYQDTVRKIIVPFEEKGQDLRGKAFQLASDYAIEMPQLHLISDPFFADNPSQAKKFRKPSSTSPAVGNIDLNFDFMDVVDSSTGWKKKGASCDNILAREFIRSIHEANWAKLAYLLQDAKNKTTFKTPVLAAMRAVSMAALGAQAEGLMELEQSRAQWDGKARLYVLGTLSRYFERSYALERVQMFQNEVKQLEDEAASKDPKKPADSHPPQKPTQPQVSANR